jgi:hypothetical protein
MTYCEGCGIPIEEHISGRVPWCKLQKEKTADQTCTPFGTSSNLFCDWCEPKQELIHDSRYKNGLGCPRCGRDYGMNEVPKTEGDFNMAILSTMLSAQTIVAYRHKEETVKVFKELWELKGMMKK